MTTTVIPYSYLASIRIWLQGSYDTLVTHLTLVRPTLATFLLVFNRLEMNCGHGTNELHGLCFYEARILLVPASPLQKEPTDPHAILKRTKIVFAKRCISFSIMFAKLWNMISNVLYIVVLISRILGKC